MDEGMSLRTRGGHTLLVPVLAAGVVMIATLAAVSLTRERPGAGSAGGAGAESGVQRGTDVDAVVGAESDRTPISVLIARYRLAEVARCAPSSRVPIAISIECHRDERSQGSG